VSRASRQNCSRSPVGPAAALAAFTVALAMWLAAVPAAAGNDLTGEVLTHLRKGEIVYAVDADGAPLVEVGAERAFVPASTLKVFTALLVREYLGLDDRFETEFYLDDDWLVVRGTGDPYLVSEELTAAAAALAARLAGRELAGVAVDDSYFASVDVPGVGRSSNPYDARNSAVAVNFNTVHVRRAGGRVVSAEPQTPITPLARAVAVRRGVTGAERVSIGHSAADIRRHAAELIAAKLREAGVRVGDGVEKRAAPSGEPIYVHANSRTIGDVCAAMLEFSSNYVANQLFLAVGAAVEGPPATLAKGAIVARRFIAERPDLEGLVVTEGSGIARTNKATAPALVAVLDRFAPQRELLRVEHGVPHKTGTLREVRSMIGYLDSRSRGTVRFVVWMDGSGHSRRWRVVDAIRRSF